MYPGTDGNPEKFAVRGLSLALPRGECFGMLGPNGAGKTSFINMVSSMFLLFILPLLNKFTFHFFKFYLFLLVFQISPVSCTLFVHKALFFTYLHGIFLLTDDWLVKAKLWECLC